jgi:hypothetical protein
VTGRGITTGGWPTGGSARTARLITPIRVRVKPVRLTLPTETSSMTWFAACVAQTSKTPARSNRTTASLGTRGWFNRPKKLVTTGHDARCVCHD